MVANYARCAIYDAGHGDIVRLSIASFWDDGLGHGHATNLEGCLVRVAVRHNDVQVDPYRIRYPTYPHCEGDYLTHVPNRETITGSQSDYHALLGHVVVGLFDRCARLGLNALP